MEMQPPDVPTVGMMKLVIGGTGTVTPPAPTTDADTPITDQKG